MNEPLLRHIPLVILLTGFAGVASPSAAIAETPGVSPSKVAPTDWPEWRGPNRDGTVNTPSDPPTQWSETEHVAWRTPIAGRGHASPTVLENQIFVPTAVENPDQQWVIALDRTTGKPLWKTIVHEGSYPTGGNDKSSFASSTIATDGSRLFANFLHDGAMWTSSLSLAGEVLWQTKVCNYTLHQGYGSSPSVYRSLVIVSGDNKGGGAVAGIDRETGEVVWKHDRPSKPNYSSPSIVRIGDQDQLIMTGCDIVESLDPMTGKVNWKVDGATTECVTTTPTDGRLVFSSGGYPRSHLSAYDATDSGKLAWDTNLRIYVPSLVFHEGYLYALFDEGIAACIRAEDGETQWKKRLGGAFSASVVLVGDRLYGTNEDGETFVFKANPERFEQLGENKLGTSVFATPTISGDQIFLRVATYQEGKRREQIVCIQ